MPSLTPTLPTTPSSKTPQAAKQSGNGGINSHIKQLATSNADPIKIETELRAIAASEGLTLGTLRASVHHYQQERQQQERQQHARQARHNPANQLTQEQGAWRKDLLVNKDGELKDCPFNCITLLQKHEYWQGRLRKNLLSGATELDSKQLTETDLFAVIQWAGQTQRMAIRSIATVHAAINRAACDQAYNPVTDWLNALPDWDGIPRLDTLLAKFLGAEANAYSAYCSRTIIGGLIERAYHPGCIMRRVVILEGKEHIGKSRFVYDLGSPWTAEISSNIESGKQFMEDIQGLWLAELEEMDALRNASASRAKAIITRRTDRYRAPWGRLSEDHQRVTVFIGTVNPNKAIGLLDWDDQNTRFFPIEVTCYDSPSLLAARHQLFAEGKALLQANPDDWWLEPHAITTAVTEARTQRCALDPWIDTIADYLETRQEEEVTIPEILREALHIPIERHDRAIATRLGKILRSLQWTLSGRPRKGNSESRSRTYQKLISPEQPGP